MKNINDKNREYLKEKFGNRITFDRIECKLYGHDIAVMPGLFKPLIGNTVPEAVIQPETEEELIELVKWASQNNIALTPRGKASSGYGGAVPVENGIVVDFYRMKKIIKIDPDKKIATVEAGVVWDKLDRELAKFKLTLRLYPTSYPSSTAGGWLAQGGAGIGSFDYGWYRDNVLSARVVLPNGDVRDFTKDDLDLISDVEGITGFITQVTLKIMPLEEIEIISLTSENPNSLQKSFEDIIDADLPIWSVMFINPRMAQLKNRAPLMEHLGRPVGERVLLPETYIMTIAYFKKNGRSVDEKLREIAEKIGLGILDEKIARHEWDQRFNLMIVKRLGPSLVPAEIVVPLSKLGNVLIEIKNKINQPLVKEGLVLKKGANGKPEVVILGFIPSDQRKFSYNFVFGLVLSLIKIAQKYGGRPYSTGLYFTHEAPRVIGRERVEKLREFKKQVDPKNVLNPGKVISNGVIGKALNFAFAFEPIVRPLGNRVVTVIGEKPEKPVRGIPGDVAWYAYSCSQCGYCVDECDQFYGRGWESQSPRGKWYWLREYMEGREKWNQFIVDTFMVCTTCELCNLRCSASLPIEPSWMKLRGILINEDRKMTFPPFEVMAAAIEAEGDIWAGYRKDRSAWFPEDLFERHGPGKESKNVYFAGCTASYVEKDIAMASARLLDAAGVDFTYLGNKENCCATPMLVAGKWDLFVDTMKKNIGAVKQAGADTIITSCPACDMMWRQIYPQWAKKLGIDFEINTKHYSEILSERIRSGDFKFPVNGEKPVIVTWHDSCHIGRVSGVYDEPRDLIAAIPHVNFVEMPHNREEAHCCGSVLTLIKEPKVAAEIGKSRIDEAAEVGADKILALCPCCEFQLRVSADKKNIPIEVIDLARFASSALGYDFPDPNPEVKAQWAVFEAMIALMTPQGFADLIKTMWPEMIDAMPFGMGKMMRLMGKMPGVLTVMKPMFPVLFPLLLPGMMPKVMPVMLSRIGEAVPMPDYMAEQMPDLMPKVMKNLMPHMVKDLVPLVTQPMIDYLRSKN